MGNTCSSQSGNLSTGTTRRRSRVHRRNEARVPSGTSVPHDLVCEQVILINTHSSKNKSTVTMCVVHSPPPVPTRSNSQVQPMVSNPLVASNSNEGEGFTDVGAFMVSGSDSAGSFSDNTQLRSDSDCSQVTATSRTTSVGTNEYVPGAEPKKIPEDMLCSPTETGSALSYSSAEPSPNRRVSPLSGTLTPPFNPHSNDGSRGELCDASLLFS